MPIVAAYAQASSAATPRRTIGWSGSIVPAPGTVLAFLQLRKTMRGGRIEARARHCVRLLGGDLSRRPCHVARLLADDALGPGPGFFPFWLSLIGLALTVAILVESLRERNVDRREAFCRTGKRPFRAAVVLVALVAAAALFEPLGFRLTMLVLHRRLAVVLGARSLIAIAFTAVAGSFGVFHVFLYWLKVPLPTGALGI